MSYSAMPKGKNVTLTTAKKAIRITPEGKCRLSLCNMGLTTFPPWLFKLTNVNELDLSRNKIKKLPENIGSFSSLRWLDLHSNNLESLPDSIGSLVRLTYLNLCNNRLTSASLPSTMGFLTSLKTLNLGLNKLDNLPPTLVALNSLEELGLFDNQFTKTPEFLKVLCNLTKLNLKGNPLLDSQGDENIYEKSKTAEVYLVHENSLCKPCIKRCRELRGGGDVDIFEDTKIRTYPGLMVPNSVAIRNQDTWRIRCSTLPQEIMV